MLNQITRVKCSENVLFLISLFLSLPPSCFTPYTVSIRVSIRK